MQFRLASLWQMDSRWCFDIRRYHIIFRHHVHIQTSSSPQPNRLHESIHGIHPTRRHIRPSTRQLQLFTTPTIVCSACGRTTDLWWRTCGCECGLLWDEWSDAAGEYLCEVEGLVKREVKELDAGSAMCGEMHCVHIGAKVQLRNTHAG
ncbi:hypothetical protein BCIN_09g05450 [Botrytis cinerea B05.10]|uniref:Uncharacterized protein n=1 Tax=Botryotinia fuckeliana (strain B05.10) TaxID=332648 RepID=A0A384JT65_BOTFB|nr:hypothetical protein BCIN_09g05450 [Botrytis cinerea B05.10]ATZ53769.1 hypothetical protein BCIN_09g05450 [Botrytis cinerea B05.10]